MHSCVCGMCVYVQVSVYVHVIVCVYVCLIGGQLRGCGPKTAQKQKNKLWRILCLGACLKVGAVKD